MFETIRNRLLLSNLLVFSLVLSGFTVVVRLVFVHDLREQSIDRLIALGQGAAGNLDDEDGRLHVEAQYLAQNITDRHLTIQWFSSQGDLIEQQGNAPIRPQLQPFTPVETKAGRPRIQAVTLPISGRGPNQQLGYVRVSQSLEEFDEIVTQLDWGLGMGITVALTISGFGTLWLNRQAMQPIEASFQRLQQFTADASHELRSPLMAIISNVEVSLKYPEGMRPDDRDAFAAVMNAADQMTQLTEDLLLLTRTGKATEMKPQPFNLADILAQLVQLYQSQAQMQQVKIITEIEPDLMLMGDLLSLTRAFRNLIQNAIYYTLAGGQVTVRGHWLEKSIQVAIADTGTGIAPEHLEHIFERFWRADQARSSDQGGAGLGLPITQAIIDHHHGKIVVTSQLGQGSCFEVRLPAILHP